MSLRRGRALRGGAARPYLAPSAEPEPAPLSDLSVSIAPALQAVPAEAWDACANPSGSGHNPFVSHAFLEALEASGCVGGRSGWTPCHVLVEEGDREAELARMLGGVADYDAALQHARELLARRATMGRR